jgi:toxin YoeB
MGEFRYRVESSVDAKKDILAYKKAGNKVAIARIERIFEELAIHPETGIGKPERMKHNYSGYWSREITKKNRIIYNIDNNIVTVSVVSAMGHYDDK